MLTISVGVRSWIYLTLTESIWTENILWDHMEHRASFPPSTKEPDKNPSTHNRWQGKRNDSGCSKGGRAPGATPFFLSEMAADSRELCVKATTSCWILYSQRRGPHERESKHCCLNSKWNSLPHGRETSLPTCVQPRAPAQAHKDDT